MNEEKYTQKGKEVAGREEFMPVFLISLIIFFIQIVIAIVVEIETSNCERRELSHSPQSAHTPKHFE